MESRILLNNPKGREGVFRDKGTRGEKVYIFPSCMGKGSFRRISLDQGLYISTSNYQVTSSYRAEVEDHQPVLAFAFTLAGSSQTANSSLKTLIMMKAGEGCVLIRRMESGEFFQGMVIKISTTRAGRLFIGQEADLPAGLQKALFEKPDVPFKLNFSLPPECRQLVTFLIENSHDSLWERLFVESKTLELMARTLDFAREKPPEKREMANLDHDQQDLLDKARALLLADPVNPPGLLELARKVGVPHPKLNQLFKSAYGETVFSCLRHKRLEMAGEMLLTGKDPITEIAYRTGFSTPSHYAAGLTYFSPNLYMKTSNAQSEMDYSNGWMVNKYNQDDKAGKIEHKNLRASLRWLPNPDWEVDLTSGLQDENDDKGYFRYFSGPLATPRHRINYDGKYRQNNQGTSHSLKLKYESKAFDLASVTGLNTFEREFDQDFDSGPLKRSFTSLNFEDTFLSQELRLVPKAGQPLKWLAGIYALNQDTQVDMNIRALGQRRNSDLTTDGLALFGQATYTLWEWLHLSAGLRLEHLNHTGQMNYQGAIGVRQKLDKDLDFNELGLKTSWLNKALTANIALFYIDLEDKQVAEFVPGMMGVQRIANPAKAKSQGVELSIHARPAAGWRLVAGVGYTDTEIDQWSGYTLDRGLGRMARFDYAGNRLPHAPQYNYNLGARYTHETGLFGRIDLLGVGDIQFNASNTVGQDPYQLVNLRLGYGNGIMGLTFWCENLFDQDYALLKMNWGSAVLGQDGAPRTIGARFTYYF